MIVIAIIGLLAAIAAPQFSAYRKRAYNTSAVCDAKNAAIAQEAYYMDHLKYASTVEDLNSHGLEATQGVILEVTGTEQEYKIVSAHESGDQTFTLTGPGGDFQSN